MKIKYNGEDYYFEDKITIREAFKEQIKNSGEIIAARYNNEIASLKQIIDKDGEISFIDRQDRDGRIIYIRGLLYIASKAFYEVYPMAMLTINYQLSNAMFVTIDNFIITDDVINNIKLKMQEIIDRDLDIRKVMMTPTEADMFYEKEKSLRGRLQADRKSVV